MVLGHVNSLLTSQSARPEIACTRIYKREKSARISFFENLPRVLPHAPEQFMRVSYGLEGPRRPGMSKKVAVVLATECQHADARIPSTRFMITPPTLQSGHFSNF